jgi:TonB family protein
LTYDVDAAGHAQNVKVSGSSGFPRLDEAAIACAVTQWRDTPAQFNGQPIPSPGHAAKVSFFMR